MRVLVATLPKCLRARDYCAADVGEIVGPNLDICFDECRCGCRSAFLGLKSGHLTSVALVAEIHESLFDILARSYADADMYTPSSDYVKREAMRFAEHMHNLDLGATVRITKKGARIAIRMTKIRRRPSAKNGSSLRSGSTLFVR